MVEKINVIPIINTNYLSFTKSEKKVAEVVLRDPNQILYTSITDLAYEAGVGETTILRFVRKLGFEGYHGFKMSLALGIQQENEMSKQLGDEILDEDTIHDVCRKVLNADMHALDETLRLMDYKALDRAVEYIANAKKIVFFGVGASSISAQEAKGRFLRITPNVEASYDSHMQSMMASLMGEDEVAVAFSYSGSTKDTIDIVKNAKKSGAKVICITRYAKSPITKYADVALLLGAKEGPYQGGALSTKIAQLYLIDILYTEYFRRNKEASKANKEKTVEAISSKLY